MLRIYLLATVGGCFMYQLGERTVRIRKVVGSIPIGSTILRKITAILAVIFRLTTIIPQTAENPDRF